MRDQFFWSKLKLQRKLTFGLSRPKPSLVVRSVVVVAAGRRLLVGVGVVVVGLLVAGRRLLGPKANNYFKPHQIKK